jgi:hypothetical protein
MTTKAEGQIILLDEARARLAKVASVDEAKKIRDTAEALRHYAKQQGIGLEAQNKAAEIKIRAERRAGELLAAVERKDHKPRKTTRRPDGSITTYTDTIKSAGISEPSARRWQSISKIPEPQFEAFVQTAKEEGHELTSADAERFSKEIKPDVVSRASKNAKSSPSLVVSTVTASLRRIVVLLCGAKKTKMSAEERAEVRHNTKEIRSLLKRVEGML